MRVGLPGLLFVVFLVLKLTKVIAWSWLWVTSPLWIATASFVVIIAMVVFLAVGLDRPVTFKRQRGKW